MQKLRKNVFWGAPQAKKWVFTLFSSENPCSAAIYNVFENFENFRVLAAIYNVIYTGYPL